MISRRFRAWLKISTQRTIDGLGLSLRVGFCFAVGFIILLTTQASNYDTRFTLRGPQPGSDHIVLVHLSRDDVTWMGGLNGQNSNNVIWSLKEIVETSDSFFWHPVLWDKALSYVMNSDPKAVVVTLFFGEETIRGTMSPTETQVFQKPGIFWTAKSDADGHAIMPGLASTDGKNSGILDLRIDPDGNVRHFLGVSNNIPPLSIRVTNYVNHGQNKISSFSHLGDLINFQGPPGTFKSVTFSALLKGKVEHGFFKDKIVIFDVRDIPSHQIQTPLGSMSSGELLGNVINNFVRHRWITPIPLWISTLYILVVVLLSLWLIFEYPQTVAFVFLSFLAVAIMALSAALFDLHNVWLPVAAPLSALLAAYVVLSSYRLSESERLSWESERELHYLSEVESLKNNFLSLISHDLKTPLAKIQGITDRMLTLKGTYLPEGVSDDLHTIKRTSEELRHYIGSILQLTRVEARNIKITKEVCDINTIVSDVVQKLWPLAEEKLIHIRQHLEPIFSIEVDRNLITEVLLNLVENAIKYADKGSAIEITTQEIGDQVRVEVSDNGGGIAEEDLPKIFDKFYRGSGDKTLKVTGTGLGLYLVKYFIELHGGKVFITSQLGVGTKIGFFLPVEAGLEENYADFTRSHR